MNQPLEPPYPAELLDRMAKVLALVAFEASRGRPVSVGDIVEVLDEYSREVGRENTPDEVWQAMGSQDG